MMKHIKYFVVNLCGLALIILLMNHESLDESLLCPTTNEP